MSRGGAQDARRAPLLDGREVEVLEHGAGLARDQGRVIALEQHVPVAEDAVGERRGGLVEEDKVRLAAGRRRQPRGQPAEGLRVTRGAGREPQGMG